MEDNCSQSAHHMKAGCLLLICKSVLKTLMEFVAPKLSAWSWFALSKLGFTLPDPTVGYSCVSQEDNPKLVVD
jgi:hypothetical protein